MDSWRCCATERVPWFTSCLPLGCFSRRRSSRGLVLPPSAMRAVWLLRSAPATVFAVGVCYFWPTMLGVVSERVPRSGALGLGLMGTVGMATVGLVTAPQMGRIADEYAHAELPVEQTVMLFQRAERLLGPRSDADAQATKDAMTVVARAYQAEGSLPSPETSNALRTMIASDTDEGLVGEAQAILGPADNYGGRVSFRYVVPLCAVLALIFLGLYTTDKRAGGYRVESIARA